MFEYSSYYDQFFDTVLKYCFALSFLVPILGAAINWYFHLGLNPDVALIAWVLELIWAFPVAFYLVYHPVTLPLPTWLTYGHPVTFGGIEPNVCNNPTLTLENMYRPAGGWPCFPAQLKDRFANLSGPHGWKYLIQLDARLQLCIFFVVLTIGVIAGLVIKIRKPYLDDAKPARGTCRLCGQAIPDTRPPQKSDIEKH